MTTIEVSDEVMGRLRQLAADRNTDVAGVLAEAIGLQEAFVRAKRRGGRVLIDDHGRISELSPGNAAAEMRGSGSLAAG
jgi:hypothetical protein